ncbi:hypothetical protein LCM4579_08620 [Ensifer sp. LCM 4579]|nr:hypothetical protein LCM4579_08620 [Ensifer sp. LCM 4579]
MPSSRRWRSTSADKGREAAGIKTAEDYVSIGRDIESQVLARAVHAHIHHRTFINGNRVVVFPPSPGSYASERMGRSSRRADVALPYSAVIVAMNGF